MSEPSENTVNLDRFVISADCTTQGTAVTVAVKRDDVTTVIVHHFLLPNSDWVESFHAPSVLSGTGEAECPMNHKTIGRTHWYTVDHAITPWNPKYCPNCGRLLKPEDA